MAFGLHAHRDDEVHGARRVGVFRVVFHEAHDVPVERLAAPFAETLARPAFVHLLGHLGHLFGRVLLPHVAVLDRLVERYIVGIAVDADDGGAVGFMLVFERQRHSAKVDGSAVEELEPGVLELHLKPVRERPCAAVAGHACRRGGRGCGARFLLGFPRVDETHVELLLVAFHEIAVLVLGRCDELQLLAGNDLVGHEADPIGARLAQLRLRALRIFGHEVAAFFVSAQVVVFVFHVERDGDALAHVGIEGDDRFRDVGPRNRTA